MPLAEPKIYGFQQLQQAHLQMIAALKPEGARGQAIKGGAVAAHAYAVRITHRDTGNLAGAHRIDPTVGDYLGGPFSVAASVYVGLSPHPRTGISACVYGFWEHERGGSHAFYERTVAEAGDRIIRGVGAEFLRAMPKGG